MKNAIPVFILLGVSACSSIFSIDATHLRTFKIPEVRLEQAEPTHKTRYSLLVKDAQAGELINSHKILFSKSNTEQGWYQFASWNEPPTKRLTSLLVQALFDSGYFTTVSFASTAAFADFELNIEILEFSHDLSASGYGVVRAKVLAELLETRSRKVVTSKILYSERQPASYDAEGAVLAFSDAMKNIIADLAIWLRESV